MESLIKEAEAAGKQRFSLIDNKHDVMSSFFFLVPLPLCSDGGRLFSLTALRSAAKQIVLASSSFSAATCASVGLAARR